MAAAREAEPTAAAPRAAGETVVTEQAVAPLEAAGWSWVTLAAPMASGSAEVAAWAEVMAEPRTAPVVTAVQTGAGAGATAAVELTVGAATATVRWAAGRQSAGSELARLAAAGYVQAVGALR